MSGKYEKLLDHSFEDVANYMVIRKKTKSADTMKQFIIIKFHGSKVTTSSIDEYTQKHHEEIHKYVESNPPYFRLMFVFDMTHLKGLPEVSHVMKVVKCHADLQHHYINFLRGSIFIVNEESTADFLNSVMNSVRPTRFVPVESNIKEEIHNFWKVCCPT